MSQLTPEQLALAAEIQSDLKLKDGVITDGGSLYPKLIEPTGVSMEQLEAVNERDTEILAATMYAVGQIAIPAMKADETLNKVTYEMQTVGKDTFNFAFDRTRQVRASAVGSGEGATEMKPKFGNSTVSVDRYAVGPRNPLAAVKALLTEEATAEFGQK